MVLACCGQPQRRRFGPRRRPAGGGEGLWDRRREWPPTGCTRLAERLSTPFVGEHGGCGPVDPVAAQDLQEYVAGFGLGLVVGPGGRVRVGAGVDVEHVLLDPAGGHDVERLPGRRRAEVGVGAIDGAALGPLRGGRVAKLDVGGNVCRGQPDEPAAAGALDDEAAVSVVGEDVPAVSVLDEPARCNEASVVATGDDDIADTGRGSVREQRSWGCDFAFSDAVGLGAAIEVVDGLVVGGDHQRRQAGCGVGTPCVEEQVQQGLPIPALNAAVGEVLIDDRGVSLAEPN